MLISLIGYFKPEIKDQNNSFFLYAHSVLKLEIKYLLANYSSSLWSVNTCHVLKLHSSLDDSQLDCSFRKASTCSLQQQYLSSDSTHPYLQSPKPFWCQENVRPSLIKVNGKPNQYFQGSKQKKSNKTQLHKLLRNKTGIWQKLYLLSYYIITPPINKKFFGLQFFNLALLINASNHNARYYNPSHYQGRTFFLQGETAKKTLTTKKFLILFLKMLLTKNQKFLVNIKNNIKDTSKNSVSVFIQILNQKIVRAYKLFSDWRMLCEALVINILNHRWKILLSGLASKSSRLWISGFCSTKTFPTLDFFSKTMLTDLVMSRGDKHLMDVKGLKKFLMGKKQKEILPQILFPFCTMRASVALAQRCSKKHSEKTPKANPPPTKANTLLLTIVCKQKKSNCPGGGSFNSTMSLLKIRTLLQLANLEQQANSGQSPDIHVRVDYLGWGNLLLFKRTMFFKTLRISTKSLFIQLHSISNQNLHCAVKQPKAPFNGGTSVITKQKCFKTISCLFYIARENRASTNWRLFSGFSFLFLKIANYVTVFLHKFLWKWAQKQHNQASSNWLLTKYWVFIKKLAKFYFLVP